MATVKMNPPVETTNMTIIGDSVRVQGNLSGDEDLHVLGRVDGRIELQRTLIVAQTGIVKAEVNVKNAVISGVVVGNIHASESVEITREGRMVGDIYAPRVIIVDGASFRGAVDMGDIENMPERKPGSERPRPMPATTTRPAAASPRPAITGRPAPAPARPAPPPPPPPKAEPPKAEIAKTESPKTESPKAEPPKTPPNVEDDADDGEPPAAKGLPHKAQKARVIVKRR